MNRRLAAISTLLGLRPYSAFGLRAGRLCRSFELIVLLGAAVNCSSGPAEAPRNDEQPAVAPAQPNAPPPEPVVDPQQQREAAVAELLDTIDELAELHQRHAQDCPALADAIVTFHGQRGAALAGTSADVLAHIDAEEPLRVRLRTAMESIMTASMGCRDNPAFAAARVQLFGQ